METYRAFEIRYRQALCELTHVLPISSRQLQADPALAEFWKRVPATPIAIGTSLENCPPLNPSRDDRRVLRLGRSVGSLLFTLPGLVRKNIVVPWVRI